MPLNWRYALNIFVQEHYERSTVPLHIEDLDAFLQMFDDYDEEHFYFRDHGGKREALEAEILRWRDRNARRRLAALRICRFLRDATCNPQYAACRRRLGEEPMDMTV